MTVETNVPSHDDMETIRSLVTASKIALLTTMSADGHHHSRPLAVQEVEFDGDLWFFTQDPSDKVDDIRHHPQVNATFQSNKGFLSIAGAATLVHDRDKVEEYWSKAVEAWFPDGKDDPTLALIKVHAESAEFWATDDPAVVTAFKVAKAVFTHAQPDVGENKSVEL